MITNLLLRKNTAFYIAFLTISVLTGCSSAEKTIAPSAPVINITKLETPSVNLYTLIQLAKDKRKTFLATTLENIEKNNFIDINAIDPVSNLESTALHQAIEIDSKNIAIILLQNGADINRVNKEGHTPLYIAVFEGYNDMVAFLLENQANVNLPSKSNTLPIHTAIRKNYVEIASLLISKKEINLNAPYRYGNTPLHLAIEKNNLSLIKLLLKNGVSRNIKNSKNKTPLDLAKEKRNEKFFIENKEFLLKELE